MTNEETCVHCGVGKVDRRRLMIDGHGFCSDLCEYEALKPTNWTTVEDDPPTPDEAEDTS